MTKDQLQCAVEIATSNEDLSTEMEQIDIFSGYGLSNFKPVTVTVKQLAALVRWQCAQFNGGIDAQALNEIAELGKKRFQVV